MRRMDRQWTKGTRYCLTCCEETLHELLYVGKYLKAGRCVNCGASFENHILLLRIYLKDLMDRIVSKPYRVYSHLVMNGSWRRPSTWFTYARRAACKPVEEVHNIEDILAKESDQPRMEGGSGVDSEGKQDGV